MDLTELRRLSAKHELSLNYIAKDEKISELLLFFQDKKNIILKGGTPINRIYLKEIGKMRFSEDIDFDYFTKASLKKAKQELIDLMKGLKNFIIEKPRIMHQTIRFDTYFTNPLGMKDRIMVEFRGKNKKISNTEKKIIDFGFVPAKTSLLSTYKLEEFIILKLNALSDRRKGKDIYDLFYLLDLDFNKTKIIKKLPKDFKTKLKEKLTSYVKQYKTIQNTTNHYIPRHLRPDWRSFILNLSEKLERLFEQS